MTHSHPVCSMTGKTLPAKDVETSEGRERLKKPRFTSMGGAVKHKVLSYTALLG